MKKLIALIIAGMMSFSLVACGGSDTSEEPASEAATDAGADTGAEGEETPAE